MACDIWRNRAYLTDNESSFLSSFRYLNNLNTLIISKARELKKRKIRNPKSRVGQKFRYTEVRLTKTDQSGEPR